jgi:hypothetical protein
LHYCPFCGIQQPTIKPIETQLPFDPQTEHREAIKRGDIIASLKFNRSAMFYILNAKKFTRSSTLIILAASLFAAIVPNVIQVIFSSDEYSLTEGAKSIVFIFGIHTTVLFSIVFFSRNLLLPFHYDINYQHIIRHMGSLSYVLIGKDFFMIPTILYIYVFEKKEGEDVANGSYIILTMLLLVFLLIHFLALIKHITNTSNSISAMYVGLISLLVFIFSLYTIATLDAILRL